MLCGTLRNASDVYFEGERTPFCYWCSKLIQRTRKTDYGLMVFADRVSSLLHENLQRAGSDHAIAEIRPCGQASQAAEVDQSVYRRDSDESLH